MSVRYSELLRQTAASLFVIAALATAAAAAAPAGSPVKGATYSGRVKVGLQPIANGFPISFKVNRTGTKVSRFAYDNSLPLFCQGGGGPTKVTFSAATVRSGRFTSRITERTVPAGVLIATATLTGTFKAKRKESGKLAVRYSKAPSCNGTTTYQTAAR